MFTLSGKLETLCGPFVLAPDGSQSGEIDPLGQIIPPAKSEKEFGLNIVWPAELADDQARLPGALIPPCSATQSPRG